MNSKLSVKFARRLLAVLLIAGFGAGGLNGCATTKGALAGAAIGGLAGDAGKGARVGATVGFVVDVLD